MGRIPSRPDAHPSQRLMFGLLKGATKNDSHSSVYSAPLNEIQHGLTINALLPFRMSSPTGYNHSGVRVLRLSRWGGGGGRSIPFPLSYSLPRGWGAQLTAKRWRYIYLQTHIESADIQKYIVRFSLVLSIR